MRMGKLLIAALVVLCLSARGVQAADISVTTSTDAGATVNVGDIVNVMVQALVSNPQDANDGIFTFDQNFFIANQNLAAPSPFVILGVTRPGTDPLLGGSDGTPSPTGYSDIAGGYSLQTQGISTPVTLYTVQLGALSPGTATLSSGPSTNPYGVDFTLYETTSPTVTYSPGPTLTVAVPEPSLALLLAGVLGIGACLRRSPARTARGPS
ncbi:MAG TPA: hypothetical protein VFC78_01860 [Tepidisphaeraceae bacterium]|nr:hypothetical protein [Tepidisphaeraceae bacterium]